MEQAVKKTRGAAVSGYNDALCHEKHRAIEENLARVFHSQDEFYDSMAEMTAFTRTQTVISGQIMEQLREMNMAIKETNKRVKDLEDVPKRRWESSISIITQFVILGALAIIVAKMGL